MATMGGSEFEIESLQGDAGKNQLPDFIRTVFSSFFCINYDDLAMNDSGYRCN